jgi:hypothetical protein
MFIASAKAIIESSGGERFMNPSRPERSSQLLVATFLLAMTIGHVAMVVAVWPSLRSGYQDFTIFYTAGSMVRNGQVSTLYDLSAQYRTQREFAPDVRIRKAALPYNHPPFEALLFVPFSSLAYVPAFLLWTALSLLLLAASLTLLRTFAEIRALSPALLALAAAGFFPVAISLIQGQDTVLLLLIVVASMILMSRTRAATAGAVLALGLFKPHFAGPLALLLAARRPRLLAGFVPMGIVLAGVSVATLGWNGAFHYIGFVLHLESSGAGGAIGANDMPNLRGLIDTLAGSRTGTGLSQLVVLVISVGLYSATLRHIRKFVDIQSAFALATVVTILISYHGLPYDLILLLPVALFLFANQTRSRADVAILLLLFLTPLYALLWLRFNQFAWFALILIALLWRLWRTLRLESSPAGVATTSPTTP